jgi:hypothetical protein
LLTCYLSSLSSRHDHRDCGVHTGKMAIVSLLWEPATFDGEWWDAYPDHSHYKHTHHVTTKAEDINAHCTSLNLPTDGPPLLADDDALVPAVVELA